jgi:DNA (cytosine-5)-methyltransferase 1
LQGIPDNFTKITEKSSDGPRYKMIGNGFAVPCVAWIGKRIQIVEDMLK